MQLWRFMIDMLHLRSLTQRNGWILVLLVPNTTARWINKTLQRQVSEWGMNSLPELTNFYRSSRSLVFKLVHDHVTVPKSVSFHQSVSTSLVITSDLFWATRKPIWLIQKRTSLTLKRCVVLVCLSWAFESFRLWLYNLSTRTSIIKLQNSESCKDLVNCTDEVLKAVCLKIIFRVCGLVQEYDTFAKL